MHLLILAAGASVALDGVNRLSININNKNENIYTRLKKTLECDVTVVVGYKAVEVISLTYEANHVNNAFWHETGSAYSAYLGLDEIQKKGKNKKDEMICIIPSDLIFSESAAESMKLAISEKIYGVKTEFRNIYSTNLIVQQGSVCGCYEGKIKSIDDPVFRGVIMIKSSSLNKIIESCLNYKDKSFLEAVLDTGIDFEFEELDNKDVYEINCVEDYLDYIKIHEGN
jgi:choline kinase